MAVKASVVEQAEQVAAQASEKGVHTVIRGIGNYSNAAEGVFTVEEVDAYLGYWLNSGWRLFSAHNTGVRKSGVTSALVYEMIFVLVKD